MPLAHPTDSLIRSTLCLSQHNINTEAKHCGVHEEGFRDSRERRKWLRLICGIVCLFRKTKGILGSEVLRVPCSLNRITNKKESLWYNVAYYYPTRERTACDVLSRVISACSCSWAMGENMGDGTVLQALPTCRDHHVQGNPMCLRKGHPLPSSCLSAGCSTKGHSDSVGTSSTRDSRHESLETLVP